VKKKVLFVLTSNDRLGSSGEKTGAYLPEVVHAYEPIAAAGYDVVFASPAGGRPPLDGIDRDDAAVRGFLDDPETMAKLENTLRLADVDLAEYAAVYFPGGTGTMWDFPDEKVGAVATQVYESGGVVAAVCHGPAALVNARLSDGDHLVAGRTVASFTDDEERADGNDEIVPFLLESTLIERGANHTKAPNFQEHVVVDGRLVTGQNPASAALVGRQLVSVLAKLSERSAA